MIKNGLKIKKISSVIVLMIFSLYLSAQTAPNKYWIAFSDKQNSPYSISNPLAFLSQRALDRRTRMGIGVSAQDFPVNPSYLDSVVNAGAIILTTSRWHNGATVYTADTNVIAHIRTFTFVESIQKSAHTHKQKVSKPTTSIFPISEKPTSLLQNPIPSADTKIAHDFSYGYAYPQISMIKGDYLHHLGYAGEGMLIGVIDAGFFHADALPAFDSLWTNNQIIGHKDFVDANANIFEQSSHGMMVLSIIGGNIPDSLVGTAPKASFLLLRSEDAPTENLIEEDNWVAAIEYADSAGVDVVNSSLGYTTFDDTTIIRTYSNMTGRYSRASLAATYAARRGMILCLSAGNSAEQPWHFIGTPADADSVLTVGAVDIDRNYALFSSVGPAADGRIKPDVATMGQATYVQDIDSLVTFGNGTSFSSPVLTGAVACLWQAFPEKSNFEIMDAIRKSASQFYTPDTLIGYGIPDFQIAFQRLLPNGIISSMNHQYMSIFPNPISENQSIVLSFFSEYNTAAQISIFDNCGKIKFQTTNKNIVGGDNMIPITIPNRLERGIYFIQVKSSSFIYNSKIIKN